MNEISFTSLLVPIRNAQFRTIETLIGEKYHAKYPWNFDTAVVGADVFTKGICDCSGCIVSDGQEAIALHLNPEEELNHSLYFLKRCFRNKFCLNRPDLTAIVIGSKDTQKSNHIFENFISFLKEANIPTTILKESKDPVSIAYKSSSDTFYITSESIDTDLKNNLTNFETLRKNFKQFILSEQDEI